MKNLIIKTNNTNNNLYCLYSKEKIHIGERYVTVYEQCLDEKIEKVYKKEYIDFIIDEE